MNAAEANVTVRTVRRVDKVQSAGAYFGDWDGAAVFSAMPRQAEREVAMMTDGSVLAWLVAGTPVEPKSECWLVLATASRD